MAAVENYYPNPIPTCVLCCLPSRYLTSFLKRLLSESLSGIRHCYGK